MSRELASVLSKDASLQDSVVTRSDEINKLGAFKAYLSKKNTPYLRPCFSAVRDVDGWLLAE